MTISPWKPIFGAFLALASSYLAYRSWGDAQYAYLSNTDPEAASQQRPQEAGALARSLDIRERRAGVPAPPAKEVRNIQLALGKNPLSRVLLRQLGAVADQNGDTNRADFAFGLSNQLSRRDALTQLWWIERSVQKNDLRAAIRHYHAALSAHPELKPALLPILAKSLSFPDIREAVRPYLVRQAPWVKDVLDPEVSPIDAGDVAKLIDPVPEAVRGREYEGVVARILSALAEDGLFLEAGKLAKRIVPSFNTGMISSFPVSSRTTDTRFGTLAWGLTDTGRLMVSPNEHGGFEIDIEPLVQGDVAARIVQVTGGRSYLFRQSVRSSANASFTWNAACVPSGIALWNQRFTAPTQTRRDEFTLTVPSECKGMKFSLSARGPEGQQAAHVAFEGLELTSRSD